MAGWGLRVALFVASVALAGCALVSTSSGLGGSCADVPGGVCSEQIDLAGARHPGATNVEVSCGVPVCDRKAGSGTAAVTLRDGAKVIDAFTYAGDPAPVPRPACVKLGLAECQALADQQVDQAPPSKRIVGVKVTCTAVPCTETAGEADVELTFADGAVISGGTSWSGGLP